MDLGLITEAVLACLKPAKKRRRYDTIELFASTLGVTRRQAALSLAARDADYLRGVDIIARKMLAGLVSGNIDIRKPGEVERFDACSRKVRKVAVLNIRNLLYDHVAVIGLTEACRSIGEYQVSSIPGRGAAYGDKAVRNWIRKTGARKVYHVKLDIRNFYGSVDQERLLAWLGRRVANHDLMCLVRKLLTVTDSGMAIGSYLSQTLANLYLSSLYHLAKEDIYKERRGKRLNVFRHALFYMDDMLFLGFDKRAMGHGVERLVQYAHDELGLEIKPTWCIHELCARYPVDIMGYRYTKEKVSLRRRIYKYARRMTLRACRRGLVVTSSSCRLVSYKGYMERTASLPKGIDCCNIFKEACNEAGIYHGRKSSLHKQAGTADRGVGAGIGSKEVLHRGGQCRGDGGGVVRRRKFVLGASGQGGRGGCNGKPGKVPDLHPFVADGLYAEGVYGRHSEVDGRHGAHEGLRQCTVGRVLREFLRAKVQAGRAGVQALARQGLGGLLRLLGQGKGRTGTHRSR